MKHKAAVLSLAMLLAGGLAGAVSPTGPYQATGIKICEAGTNSVIIWTRLTKNAVRAPADAPLPEVTYRDPKTGEVKKSSGRPDMEPVVTFPEGSDIDTIQGATPGTTGQLQVWYRKKGEESWQETAWRDADPDRDFTAHFPLTGLDAGTRYELRVICRAGEGAPLGQTIEGRFETAPAPDVPARVVFTVTTGSSYPDHDLPGQGYKMYAQMLKIDTDFFVHTGDILYYDKLAKTLPLALYHWARIYSFPTNVDFHRQVDSYFIKDDHDTWMNDSWPTKETRFMGDFTFKQGQKVFLDEVGMGDSIYRTRRWGKDLQIWLVEGRDFRSSNDMPDGPEKTIWGEEQKAWFKKTVAESDATFRVLISPTPLVGPDRQNKNDNHANAGFTHEGGELRAFIASQKNMVVVCGDRHWQYVSRHPESGVLEFSSGPATNQHAGGWSQEDFFPDYHLYLNVTGGFLAGIVEREEGKPTLTFRHYSADGEVNNEYRLTAE